VYRLVICGMTELESSLNRWTGEKRDGASDCPASGRFAKAAEGDRRRARRKARGRWGNQSSVADIVCVGLLSRAPSRGLLEPCARDNQSTISIVSVWVGWNSTLVRMQRAGVQASPLVTRQKRSTSSGEAGTATSWFVHTALACAESGSMGTWRSSRGAGPRTSRRSRRRRSSYPVSDHSAVEPGASSTTSSPNPTRIGATSLGIAPSRRYSGVIRTWSRWPR
jgi:hypothetical protein